jgi:hypothetical protein
VTLIRAESYHRLHCGQDLRIIKSRIAPFAWLLFGKLQQTSFDKTQYESCAEATHIEAI